MVTSDEHVSVMTHVLKLVGDPSDGTGEIEKTLKANGINTVLDILNLGQAIVSTLMYKDGNKKIELVKGHQTLLITAADFSGCGLA